MIRALLTGPWQVIIDNRRIDAVIHGIFTAILLRPTKAAVTATIATVVTTVTIATTSSVTIASRLSLHGSTFNCSANVFGLIVFSFIQVLKITWLLSIHYLSQLC